MGSAASLFLGVIGVILGFHFKDSYSQMRKRKLLASSILLLIKEQFYDLSNNQLGDLYIVAQTHKALAKKVLAEQSFEEYKKHNEQAFQLMKEAVIGDDENLKNLKLTVLQYNVAGSDEQKRMESEITREKERLLSGDIDFSLENLVNLTDLTAFQAMCYRNRNGEVLDCLQALMRCDTSDEDEFIRRVTETYKAVIELYSIMDTLENNLKPIYREHLLVATLKYMFTLK